MIQEDEWEDKMLSVAPLEEKSPRGVRVYTDDLTPNQIQLLVCRIMSGRTRVKLDGKTYYICNPSLEAFQIACEAYEDAFQEAVEQRAMSEDDMLLNIIEQGLWSNNEENEFQDLPNQIKDLKKQLFENFYKDDAYFAGKKLLDRARERHQELLSRRMVYYSATDVGQAESAKNRILLASSIHDVDGQPIFKLNSLLSNRSDLVEQIGQIYMESRLSEKQLRAIARSDYWRSYWTCTSAERKLFGIPVSQYSDEQRTLVGYTKLYISINEHPERPSEALVNDDDAFDGWLLIQNEKVDKEAQRDGLLRNVSDRVKNSGEVLLIASNKNEAKKIHDLNSRESNMIRKQRLNYLHKHEGAVVCETEMPDTKQKIRTDLAKMMGEHIRGKK